MLAVTKTAGLSGIRGMEVTVEVSAERGLPAYHVIGLGDTAVKESAERVRGAIMNSGFDYPKGRITVNLSPAWVRKSGSHYDLAIAAALLAAQGLLPSEVLEGKAFLGELNLNGEVQGVRGVLPMMTGLCGRTETVYLAAANRREGTLAAKESGTHVAAVSNLRQLVASLRGEEETVFCEAEAEEGLAQGSDAAACAELDFADVKGQQTAKEAITIAVAGGHGILLLGSPGTGKTMLARRIPTILPAMTQAEQLETSMIYSVVGKLNDSMPIMRQRPFRELNSTTTPAGILGGGFDPQPGEVSLAHNGILFIDEAYSLVNPDMPNDFGTEAVDALVKLMEDNRDNLVIIVAGYTEEMKTFLKSNTGLVSRFNKFINFPDYTKEELVSILSVMAGKAGLEIEEGAKVKVLELLNKMKASQWKNFGNARGIRNLFEKFVMNQANRLVKIENPTRDDLMIIKEADVFDR